MPWSQKTVVVPIDFSGESEKAIRTALELVQDPENIHCVHVLLPLEGISPGLLLGKVSDEKREQAAREHLAEYLAEKHFIGLTTDVLFGSPGTKVAEYADRVAADLIIISTHGFHGVKRLVLGSVAERVIRHAHCSALVLRRNDAE